MAYHLQNKFENVDTIAKDSCFHFGYQGQVEERDDNDQPIMKDKYIESHFDFKLNGNINGQESGNKTILLLLCIVMNSKVERVAIQI